jgi:Fic family protein
MDRAIVLDAQTAADVADAERAIADFNGGVSALGESEGLARLLLRAEAVASSKIEGLEIGNRRLLKEDLVRQLGEPQTDVTATEILNNIESMKWAVDSLSGHRRIGVSDVLEVHKRLARGTRLETSGGQLRQEQNWIGGSQFNPCSAAYVPPPWERVSPLIDDLCQFASSDLVSPVTQAALVHAQFETIHPFADGNGRVGRALIHVILKRRGLAVKAVPPVSLVLATWADGYVNGLTRSRYLGAADSPDAVAGIDEWVRLFAAACIRAVADARSYERQVRRIQERWRTRLGRVRKGSATDLLITALPGAPLVTVQTAAAMTGRSTQAVNEAIPRLLEARVLSQTTAGRRNRAFEAKELIDAFTRLERRLASPDADTRATPPVRRVPQRRQ